jgi:hypothetical protein
VPRISIASSIFLCGRVETPIWNVMRDVPLARDLPSSGQTAHPCQAVRLLYHYYQLPPFLIQSGHKIGHSCSRAEKP